MGEHDTEDAAQIVTLADRARRLIEQVQAFEVRLEGFGLLPETLLARPQRFLGASAIGDVADERAE